MSIRSVIYYGRYASASRGKRRQQQKAVHGPDSEDRPAEEESAAERFSRRRRRSWARLLRKIYDVDPLRCGCGGSLRVIAVIEQPHVIRRILAHLKLGQGPQRAPPPRLFPKSWNTFWRNFPPSRLKPFEPPTTRSSGTRLRIGPTEELELFSRLAISLCLFSLPTGSLASPRLRSHPRYTISTLGIPFDFPIHLISATFGLLTVVSTLFPSSVPTFGFLISVKY